MCSSKIWRSHGFQPLSDHFNIRAFLSSRTVPLHLSAPLFRFCSRSHLYLYLSSLNQTVNVATQSTYIYRVPQCMSPRRKWDSPTPSLASECAPPPEIKGETKGGGGANSPAGEGLVESQFRRLEKKLSILPTLSISRCILFRIPLCLPILLLEEVSSTINRRRKRW
jgi:hypothetical protein